MQVGTLREDFIKNFVARYMVRLHMMLIFGTTVLSGVLSSKALLALDVNNPAVRYPLSVLIAYLAFWLCVRLWLHFVQLRLQAVGSAEEDALVSEQVQQELARQASDAQPASRKKKPRARSTAGRVADAVGGVAMEVADTDVAPGSIRAAAAAVRTADEANIATASGGSSGIRTAGSKGGGFNLDLGDGNGEGFLVIVLLFALIGLIGLAAAALIVQAPLMLAEAAFELALAGGLVRSARTRDGADWAGGVLKRTGLWFLGILLVSYFLGAAMYSSCPEATTLSEYFGAVCQGG